MPPKIAKLMDMVRKNGALLKALPARSANRTGEEFRTAGLSMFSVSPAHKHVQLNAVRGQHVIA